MPRTKIVSTSKIKMPDEYRIPFHIQEEIMKRLPVKSLVKFRSVSKAWKSLIDSSQFITAHSLQRHTQPHHLLVPYQNAGGKLKCVCIDDDETFPQNRSILTLPPSVKQLAYADVHGMTHGLACYHSYDAKLAVIWNPSIRNSISVAVPNPSFLGFGVCPVTTDFKIVAVTQSWDESNIETSYKCEVMVYTLSSGEWRSLSTNLPTKPLHRWYRVATADGFIYWLDGLPVHNMIISFDLTNESFQMIDLLPTFARHSYKNLSLSKLRESLVIHEYDGSTNTIWKMEGGVQKSFTKLFTIETPTDSIMGYTKSGVPIRFMYINDDRSKLVVYEPNSEHNNVFKFSGVYNFFHVFSYMETLLLLGRSDCCSY